MRTCLPLAAAAIALLLMAAAVQSIRLDAESHAAAAAAAAAAASCHEPCKPVDQGVGMMSKAGGDASASGEVKEAISEEKDRAVHRMPEIHLDYYGPRGHNPRHH